MTHTMLNRQNKNNTPLILGALIGSLLLHILLILLIIWGISRADKKESLTKKSSTQITPELIQVVRKKAKNQNKKASPLPPLPPSLPAQKKESAFMKTIEEQKAKEAPKDPAYIGARNTKVAGDRASNPDGLDNLPSIDGHKKRNDADLGLIDQRQQDGDISHEQIAKKGNPAPPSPTVPAPAIRPMRPAAPTQQQAVSPPKPQNPITLDSVPTLIPEVKKPNPAETNKKAQETSSKTPKKKTPTPPEKKPNSTKETTKEKNNSSEEKRNTRTWESNSVLEQLKKTAEKFNLPDPTKPLPPSTTIEEDLKIHSPAIKNAPITQAIRKMPPPTPAYDPALPNGGKPGYKSEERKTRITGRMSGAGITAANVKATPLGAYQANFMRALNKNWDAECVSRRDFIIPGSLKIRFILDKNGVTSGLQLINKEGTSEVQKGFTFHAIRKTKMPPMPPSVQKELGEESTEIIIDFFF